MGIFPVGSCGESPSWALKNRDFWSFRWDDLCRFTLSCLMTSFDIMTWRHLASFGKKTDKEGTTREGRPPSGVFITIYFHNQVHSGSDPHIHPNTTKLIQCESSESYICLIEQSQLVIIQMSTHKMKTPERWRALPRHALFVSILAQMSSNDVKTLHCDVTWCHDVTPSHDVLCHNKKAMPNLHRSENHVFQNGDLDLWPTTLPFSLFV